MDLFVYSDESGVLDYVHNNYYVFGGILFIGKDEKDIAQRKYLSAERAIRNSQKYNRNDELKASKISNKEKAKLYRSLNNYYKFAVVIRQNQLNINIFNHKKSKQRFLDYAYKIGLKALLQKLIRENIIDTKQINNIWVYPDEHTTATDGKYELTEGLLREYKYGTFNDNWQNFFPPILPDIAGLIVTLCNSSSTTLVRAADIIANHVYHCAEKEQLESLKNNDHLVITELP